MSVFKRLVKAVFGNSENGTHSDSDKPDNGVQEAVKASESAPEDKTATDLALEADEAEFRDLMNRVKATNTAFDAAQEERVDIQKQFDTQVLNSPTAEEIQEAIAAKLKESSDE